MRCFRDALPVLLWRRRACRQTQAGFSGGELARTWQRPVGQRSPGAVLSCSAHLSQANEWGGALDETYQE